MSEQGRSTKARRYQMNKRAEQVETTRQRIVDAAVALHGSVGPAKTTIAGVAEQAGVTRLTVYRHFADDAALYSACSSHWLSQQQLPDPAAWSELTDPLTRLHAGLADLYRFYRDGEPMLRRIYGDWAALPEGHRSDLAQRNNFFRDRLLEPFPEPDSGRLRAVVAHSVSFWTWRSLCHDNGLSNDDAVQAMTGLAAMTAGLQQPC
ncbi:TetR/AcrR family transcriptional regulator [Pseudarthrobacter sp. IC2-21]|uniref:TetR/AcrR family transcriptional regulator n=1 Tax=Pseudarthrobacter sp. IC2-21 TaxID=3092262 RepID=UPI002A6A84BC|nr:TetR/AcrR family transcriptional regulator [Pseudarthrobacter sp. IC2-21]